MIQVKGVFIVRYTVSGAYSRLASGRFRAHIVGIHVHFDEKQIRPIFKQEKREWVAVATPPCSQRTATPTVKRFLRVHLPEFLGGLLKAIFPFSRLQFRFYAQKCDRISTQGGLLNVL